MGPTGVLRSLQISARTNCLGPFFPDSPVLYKRNARPPVHLHARVRMRAGVGTCARGRAGPHVCRHICRPVCIHVYRHVYRYYYGHVYGHVYERTHASSPAETAEKWEESFSILQVPGHACHATWDPSRMVYTRNGR